MNPWLTGAAALSVLIAAVHSVLCERRIFQHLRRTYRVVPTEGGTVLREYQVRILWSVWHGLSAMGIGFAGVLLWLSQPAAQALSAGRLEWWIAMAFGSTGLLVLVSNRGRHMGWLPLLGAAALVTMGR
jgi:hypothetical protein